MARIAGGPFGSYAVTEVVSEAAQDEINAQIDKLAAFFPDPVTDVTKQGNVSSPHTDFDRIDPQVRAMIRDELDALKAAIEAAPTA